MRRALLCAPDLPGRAAAKALGECPVSSPRWRELLRRQQGRAQPSPLRAQTMGTGAVSGHFLMADVGKQVVSF